MITNRLDIESNQPGVDPMGAWKLNENSPVLYQEICVKIRLIDNSLFSVLFSLVIVDLGF